MQRAPQGSVDRGGSPSTCAGHGISCAEEEIPAILIGASARWPGALRYKVQHVPASRDGKQRRQAAALHIRCADRGAATEWKDVAKHLRRA